MTVSEEKMVYFAWLQHEHGSAVLLLRMYQLMRGTLLLGSVAAIGVITTIYRESIRVYQWTTLEASGIVTHSERAIPEPVAVIITSGVILAMTVWVIWMDHNLAIHQRVCEIRGRDIENQILPRRGVVGRLLRAHDRAPNVFLLGRGLLIILSTTWIAVFAYIAFISPK